MLEVMKLLRLIALVAGLLAVTVGQANANSITGPALVFAEWNVLKANEPAPAPAWSERRGVIGRVLSESGADVIGLAEATEHPVAESRSQWTDIQQLVAPAGYVAPKLDVNECTFRVPCTHTSALLFRGSTVEQVTFPNGNTSAGATRLGSMVEGMTDDGGLRKVVWAYLRGRNGTGTFLAIAAHLPTQKDAAHENDRVVWANALTGWVQAMNAQRGITAPTILMADVNSYAFRQPQGAQFVLEQAGWRDAYVTAQKKLGARYATINVTPSTRNAAGFPRKPYAYSSKRAPTRIDYIFTLGAATATEYETVVRLLANGTFDPLYRGSDHNMIRARIVFTGGA
jgi:endonuclease/exonuclease/phosphatase family metal-dependent hydrolase